MAFVGRLRSPARRHPEIHAQLTLRGGRCRRPATVHQSGGPVRPNFRPWPAPNPATGDRCCAINAASAWPSMVSARCRQRGVLWVLRDCISGEILPHGPEASPWARTLSRSSPWIASRGCRFYAGHCRSIARRCSGAGRSTGRYRHWQPGGGFCETDGVEGRPARRSCGVGRRVRRGMRVIRSGGNARRDVRWGSGASHPSSNVVGHHDVPLGERLLEATGRLFDLGAKITPFPDSLLDDGGKRSPRLLEGTVADTTPQVTENRAMEKVQGRAGRGGRGLGCETTCLAEKGASSKLPQPDPAHGRCTARGGANATRTPRGLGHEPPATRVTSPRGPSSARPYSSVGSPRHRISLQGDDDAGPGCGDVVDSI